MKRILATTLALLLVLINLPLQAFAVAGGTAEEQELPMIPLVPQTALEARADQALIRRGEQLTVSLLVVSNEEGFNSITFAKPEIPGFQLLSGENGEMGTTFDFDSLTFSADTDMTDTGTLGTLRFLVTSDAPAGEATLKLEVLSCHNAAGQDVHDSIAPATTYVQVAPLALSLKQGDLAIGADGIALGTAQGANQAELTAVFTPDDATARRVTWTFEDKGVIDLHSNGLTATVVGLKKGTATVTVTSVEDESLTASCVITVACSHVNQTLMGYVAPTKETPGYSGDLICNDCGATVEQGKPISRIMDPVKFAVEADQTTVKKGDTVKVTVSITENPGIAFLFVTPKLGEGLEAVTNSDGGIAYEAGDIVATMTLTGENLVFLFEGDNAETGTLFTITAKVTEDAPQGTADLGIELRQILNWAEEDVPGEVEAAAVTVVKAPTAITLNQTAVTIATADGENNATLTATLTPDDAYAELIWTTTDETVVSLSPDGLTATVTGLKKGGVTVRAASAVDEAVYAECVVTVDCSHEKQTLTGAVEATCTKKGYTGDMVCDACGETVTHGEETDMIPHTWVNKVARDYRISIANCQSPAVYKKSCSVCGTAHETETFTSGTVNADVHANTHLEGVKAPTETEPGYSGDLICDDCGKVAQKGAEIPCLKPAMEIALSADKTRVQPGDIVTVTVNITKNPGIAYLTLVPKAAEGLEIVLKENGSIAAVPGAIAPEGGIECDRNVIVIYQGDSTETGALLSFQVKVSEAAATGSTLGLDLAVMQALNWALEDVPAAVTGATLTVVDDSILWGDANGDGEIDGQDIILIKQYLAAYNYESNSSSVEVFPGADANGDGEIDGQDIILIKQYLAAFNYETGESSVKLGPQ